MLKTLLTKLWFDRLTMDGVTARPEALEGRSVQHRLGQDKARCQKGKAEGDRFDIISQAVRPFPQRRNHEDDDRYECKDSAKRKRKRP